MPSNKDSASILSRRTLVIVGAALTLALAAIGTGVALSGRKNSNVSAAAGVGSQDSPSSTSSFMPSRAPFFRPTGQPSRLPSNNPTQLPSPSPSELPTAAPTRVPTLPPTFPKISPSQSFRLRLHWQNGYYWQEESVEREWCLECVRCNPLTTSEFGEGCVDEEKDVFDCREGDELWLQRCHDSGGGNAEFQVLRGADGLDQFKVRGENLCLERVKSRLIVLRRCQSGLEVQKWSGFSMDQPFAWHPASSLDLCVSQHHHPKATEIIYAEDCRLAHYYDTGLWRAI